MNSTDRRTLIYAAARIYIWQQAKHSDYTLACFSRLFKEKKKEKKEGNLENSRANSTERTLISAAAVAGYTATEHSAASSHRSLETSLAISSNSPGKMRPTDVETTMFALQALPPTRKERRARAAGGTKLSSDVSLVTQRPLAPMG